MKRPNIIIINPDEMRWDSMGHTGNPAAATLFLDQFMKAEAVSFDRAYCQNPVCVPSRCSFFTGLYPHVHGHRTMSYLLHEQETSMFKELKEAGYYVWMNGRNDLIAAQISGLAEEHASEIYYYDKSKPSTYGKMFRDRGAEDSDSANKNGTEGWDTAQKGGAEAFGTVHDREYPYSHFGGLMKGKEDRDWEDTNAAIQRILHPAEPQKPLCLFLGWMNPHPPYEVEESYYNRIDPQKLPERIKLADTEGKSRMVRRLHELVEMDDYTQEQWKQMRRVYLAQCAKVDDMFQAVCKALKVAGIYDDSAIFFLSDHGDFCGDYDLPEKAQNTFEDCLTRVPLLIKPPKDCPVDPGRTTSLAELVDFYATVMDYAGVKPDHDQFGKSLRPVIADRSRTVREFVCCEGGRLAGEIQCDEWHENGPKGPREGTPYWPKKTAQKEDLTHEKGTMICDGRYKFVQRHSGEHEFYDLLEDPGETRNMYGQPQSAEKALDFQQKLLDWYQQTCDTVPRACDRRFTEDMMWRIVRDFCPPQMEQEMRRFLREKNPDIGGAIHYAMQLSAPKIHTTSRGTA